MAELIDESVALVTNTSALAVEIAGISDDSREIEQGDLFVAVAGAASDGHDFAAQAVARGAVAVAAEHQLQDITVPVVVVPQLKRKRGDLASRLLGRPSEAMRCVGVTGTNGKTSIACFIAELATRLGEPGGYMGTIGWGVIDRGNWGDLVPSELTTESAIIVQKRLAGLFQQGARWVVMEASSHALDQHRLEGVALDYAVFSNLSRDHLDYHQDFEEYGEAKARLFTRAGLKAAVINVDDEFGRQLSERLSSAVEVVTYGSCAADDAEVDVVTDVSWTDLRFHAEGVEGMWQTRWGERSFHLPLLGAFSVSNVAAAVGVLCHAGFTLTDVVEAARRLPAVPGRMEFFTGEPALVVDYAHTPDALEKMLKALRPHVSGKLVCVCGCGGDRDRGKRPLMAQAAARYADLTWFTSDNPRSEDPRSIIDDMTSGLEAGESVSICVDRRMAIEQAVSDASVGDLVVIAGKGHEEYQEVAGQRLPFSDRLIAAELAGHGSAVSGLDPEKQQGGS
ncbi:MAG: UDP-N-acetylmuramoyl-L-alanyl-D-glutamate--2,6-diaminopimelate ligase [Pseudomonadales bacterium]